MFKLLRWFIKVNLMLLLIGLVIAVIGAFLEIIMKYWALILMILVLAVSANYLWCNRFLKIKIFKPNHSSHNNSMSANLRTFIHTRNASVIDTQDQAEDFFRSHTLLRSFITKVVGVTFPNEDGSSRQEILSLCLSGEPVGLCEYTFNGKPAFSVITEHGQIGNLSQALATDLAYNYSDDVFIVAKISDITGGEDGLYYGCNILLSIYGPTN